MWSVTPLRAGVWRFTKMVMVTGGAKPTFDEKPVEVQVYRLVIVDGAVGGGWSSVNILSTHRESPVGCSAHPQVMVGPGSNLAAEDLHGA